MGAGLYGPRRCLIGLTVPRVAVDECDGDAKGERGFIRHRSPMPKLRRSSVVVPVICAVSSEVSG